MSRKLLNLCLAALLSVASTAAWALSEVNGVYQIGTAEDLVAFAKLVNAGNAYANAVLTADIDRGVDLTMIGRDGLDYQGTFDGQGHTITINAINQKEEGTAIFRNIGIHGVVQNLKVQGTITTDQKLAAGIAAWSSGIIRGCYIDVEVKSSYVGDATHGGIAAVCYGGTLIENCLAKFTIKGVTTQNCGGIVGWADGPVNIVNCLVISDGSNFDISNGGSNNIARNDGNVRVMGDLQKYKEDSYKNRPAGANFNNYVTKQWGTNKATTVVSYDNLADGRICYQLNTDQSNIAWVQRINTDPFPVPAAFGKGQVYASGPTDCDGKSEAELTFSNEGSDQAAKHEFDEYGICMSCGCFNFHMFDDATNFDQADKAILLGCIDDIRLAEGWNRVANGLKFNMKMVDDIKISTDGQLIFTDGGNIGGDFNGQGHSLTIEMNNITDNNASFLPKMTGIFENVIMHGSISTSGQYAGSVTSHTYNDKVIIRNVFSDIDINCSCDGDNTSAGIIGVSDSKTKVENVIYAGNIKGVEGGNTQCLAGFCGWAAGQTYFTNCAFIGTLNNAIGDSKNVSRNPGNVSSENVWFIQDFGFDDTDKFKVFDGGEEGINSGQLAYYLNGMQGGVERFYQKIGEDDYPMPIAKENALVYAVSANYQCDGTPIGTDVTYSNSPSGGGVLPDHEYSNGFCTVCGGLQEDYLTPVDGWYEIGNGAELLWWSHYASKHLDASAKLTDDIDMADYSDRWALVGTEGDPFYGNFDGQFHTISNLIVDMPNSNGVGLISVMNSLPSKGFGGLTDEQARNAEGVYIKNVVLDESCSLLGRGYVALVGMTAPWAGHVNIKGVMMCGDVTANGGPNAAGVFGCVMSSSCHVTIDNCGMVGDVAGPKENGSFSGWLGDWAEVTNCFAVGEVSGTESDARYFARYGNSRVNDNIKNCYALHGTQEHVGIVSKEDFASGALAWKANGSQFRTCYWYQNIGEDKYPFADPSHGTVIYAADQYFSIATEDDFGEVGDAIQIYESEALSEAVATQGLLDEYEKILESLSDATTILEFADIYDTIYVKKPALEENMAVYQTYIDKCEEIKARLEGDDTFTGAKREALEYYLTEADEPTDENPLGTYEYIIEVHTATAQEILDETERVQKWLDEAIAEDYAPGTDVSSMIVNGDFSKEKEGWTDAFCTGYGHVKSGDARLNKTVGVEAWNVTGDMYQTIENLKPGYYLVGTNAAFRPSDNRYSTNYAAGIYANGNFNYFPTVFEDYVAAADTIDQVNCNLHGDGALDLAIYDTDDETTSDEGLELLGYAVHGPSGMAAAANAGRYQVYTIGYVGEDGKLTIGIKNPGTNFGNDWTGWSTITMKYYGEDADEAFDIVLENMSARASTIMDYMYIDDQVGKAPNFPEEMKVKLDLAISDVDATGDKAALVARFSEIFQNIYEGKQAYNSLLRISLSLTAVEYSNLSLVEKTEEEETGWSDTGEMLFSDDEVNYCIELGDDLLNAYGDGAYSIEEALNPAGLDNPAIAEILAPQDEEGYYLLSTPKHFAYFRTIATEADNTAKAKLAADIDMTGVLMQPIGNSVYRFRGVFDGQGYALTNVYIYQGEQRTALFSTIDQATVKNLKLTGEFYGGDKFIAGITGYAYNSRIENCEVAVKITSLMDLASDGTASDGTLGGLIGVNESSGTVVENCLIDCPLFSKLTEEGQPTTRSCGGVCGWATNKLEVKNTLILSQGGNITNESNTVSRNPDNCTVSNVFYVEAIGTVSGTKATAEQLASGEIAYKLNGGKTENVAWFQTIGVDATPHLFDGDVVYQYGGKYMNEKPNPQLNAFAYNLEANKVGNNVVVKYTLNAEAEAIAVNFYDGDELVYTAVPNGVFTAGTHRVTVPVSALKVEDATTLSYEVVVTGKGSLDILKVGESYKFNSPYGLAINNNPASKGFGQVLVTETRPTDEYAEDMFSVDAPGALFAFDAAFEPVGSYYGGLTFEAPVKLFGEFELGFKDIRFSQDGRLFVGNASGTTTSSVYELNPDDLSEAWKPVFTGGELDEATGITYVGDDEQNRMAVGLALEGEGDDLKMYVLGVQGGFKKNNDVSTYAPAFNCAIYELGTAKEWTGAPSAYYQPLDRVYGGIPTHISIHEDGKGGLWFVQSATEHSEAVPSIKHFDAEGNEDYSDSKTNTYSGMMAVTTDGNYIAFGMGQNKVVLYETNYVPMANGSIYLDPKYSISTTESSITGLAFDYANNLYVASSGSKTLSRYTIPAWNDEVVTPGNAIGTAGLVGDLNGDDKVDIADAVTVLNIMAASQYNEAADVNNDGKVDIADFVTILNIMAAQ